jgi:hypothetical protein
MPSVDRDVEKEHCTGMVRTPASARLFHEAGRETKIVRHGDEPPRLDSNGLGHSEFHFER